MIIAYPLLPARPHDIQRRDDLMVGFASIVSPDKSFIDIVRHALLAEHPAVLMYSLLRPRVMAWPRPARVARCAPVPA